jgi:hypothetical protein
MKRIIQWFLSLFKSQPKVIEVIEPIEPAVIEPPVEDQLIARMYEQDVVNRIKELRSRSFLWGKQKVELKRLESIAYIKNYKI